MQQNLTYWFQENINVFEFGLDRIEDWHINNNKQFLLKYAFAFVPITDGEAQHKASVQVKSGRRIVLKLCK